MTYPVFVYGSLMFEEITSLLLGRMPVTQPAELRDYRRCNRRSATERPTTPAIIPCQGEAVQGLILLDVSQAELEILDCFEEVGTGMYSRIVETAYVNLSDPVEVQVYISGPTSETYGLWDERDFKKDISLYVESVVRPFAPARSN